MTGYLLNRLVIVSSCLVLLATAACSTARQGDQESLLSDKIICIDAGHGGSATTDSFREGTAGEREEWINLRVAKALQQMLEEAGAEVVMTRTEDIHVALKERGELAVASEADVFLSIHHNATADTAVNFPIIYYHANASENLASVLLARLVGTQLLYELFAPDTLISIVSDHTIFPNAGTAVLRHTYGVPGIIGEASFFTNPAEEQRLKQESYNQQEAAAYFQALTNFFNQEQPPIKEKYSLVNVPPFAVLEEADRMRTEARLWMEDYQRGKALYEEGALDSAYLLLTRSARNFPDSYLADDAHLLRANIQEQQGDIELATATKLRIIEYYVPMSE